jgi:hypothetical protein
MSVLANELRPFQIRIPEEHLHDLRRRLAETRWPEPATVPDWSQGVPLHDLQELCNYWRTEYDFHLPSTSPSAVPLILTHGWPGSFFELNRQ